MVLPKYNRTPTQRSRLKRPARLGSVSVKKSRKTHVTFSPDVTEKENGCIAPVDKRVEKVASKDTSTSPMGKPLQPIQPNTTRTAMASKEHANTRGMPTEASAPTRVVERPADKVDTPAVAAKSDKLVYQSAMQKFRRSSSTLQVFNLHPDTTQRELQQLFQSFGHISEVNITESAQLGEASKDATVVMDYRHHAAKAKVSIHGRKLHGRTVRVSWLFPKHGLVVTELQPNVTDDLLYRAFSKFGRVLEAYVSARTRDHQQCVCDGTGYVFFESEADAKNAYKECREHFLILTDIARPVHVSWVDEMHHDGLVTADVEMSLGVAPVSEQLEPFFTQPKSLLHDFASEWAAMAKSFRTRQEKLRAEYEAECKVIEERQQAYADQERERVIREALADAKAAAESEEIRRAEEARKQRLLEEQIARDRAAKAAQLQKEREQIAAARMTLEQDIANAQREYQAAQAAQARQAEQIAQLQKQVQQEQANRLYAMSQNLGQSSSMVNLPLTSSAMPTGHRNHLLQPNVPMQPQQAMPVSIPTQQQQQAAQAKQLIEQIAAAVQDPTLLATLMKSQGNAHK